MLSKQFDFKTIEKNFDNNIFLAKKNNPNHFLNTKKSYKQLSKFVSEGKEGYFDLIYIDGAHFRLSECFLFDSVYAFKLFKEVV